ncbi:DUF2283 domain-containing protein [Candidatus Pacearchaeota archaeon]|nr:DUF2283 domain-containing protein [Candidatus Pacearchaeota archaeon]|tara:strand:- start:398 stop:601 length:204 start_codon:yes stop_codon:yes gene_type:complete
MKINFDSEHDVMRITFQEGEYEMSKEVEDGIVVDMTKDNQIIAIEILDVSHRIPKTNLKEFAMKVSG